MSGKTVLKVDVQEIEHSFQVVVIELYFTVLLKSVADIDSELITSILVTDVGDEMWFEIASWDVTNISDLHSTSTQVY